MFKLSLEPSVADQQTRAYVFCLVAFGYIDGELDPAEREFILAELDRLAQHRAQGMPLEERSASISAYRDRHHATFEQFDAIVRSHFSESVGEGETSVAFVTSRLKLGCFELLGRLDVDLQRSIVEAIGELMHADGRVHPSEAAFFEEVSALLDAPIELSDDDLIELSAGEVHVRMPVVLRADGNEEHPMLGGLEWDFSREPSEFTRQSEYDIALVARTEERLRALRVRGAGALSRGPNLDSVPEGGRWLDSRVFVERPDPNKAYDALVLGDLHGCYSCLKGALLQADFFGKVRRHQEDADAHPTPLLVLLGDYIDRGRFGFTGTLRGALELFNAFPDYVVLLRGNHEFYVELSGRVLAPVRPCEAMDSLKALDGMRLLRNYRRLFDDLPTSFVFGDTLFVHGGIPRDATFESKWGGLSTLNDGDLAFEMLWSDPSDVDVVPPNLQQEVARFGFGRRQFQRFMRAAGCSLMIRGHERVTEGFRLNYDFDDVKLATLFSAGGAENRDLPDTSNYREVSPKALRLLRRDGETTLEPFDIDWRRFNAADLNAFFAGGTSGHSVLTS